MTPAPANIHPRAFLALAALKSDRPYVAGAALCLTYLGYFFLCEALWSRTPGKYL